MVVIFMAEKSLLETYEELELNTDVLNPEKYSAILKEQREYKGHTFTMKIGGTTYEVSTHFNPNGRSCVFEQFKELILSTDFYNELIGKLNE